MPARYYNNFMGRFIGIDPILNIMDIYSKDWNRYAFTNNNPIIAIDPLGKDTFLIIYGSRKIATDTNFHNVGGNFEKAAAGRKYQIKTSSSFNAKTDKVEIRKATL